MKKQKRSFEEKLPFLLAFCLPVLIMVAIFAIKGLYPFGDNCFLRTDLYHQYVAFYENFAERLREGRSLTYAFEIGLGSNYTALYAYYLSGPAHFLAVLIPKGSIIEFISVLIIVKIGLCGLTMAWFLSRKFNTRHIAVAFCGVCYALSGYLAAYSWNVMWLDVLWLTPIVLYGVELLIREGKPLLYCLTLAAAILCNYYISIMLCIFLVMYFVARIIADDTLTAGRALRCILQFGVYSLLAGGLAAVLLVPCYNALQLTASAGSSFPKTVSNYFSIFEMLSRHLMTVETETGLDHWPNLYCGVGVFLFLPLYFMNRDVPFKEKIVNTVLLFLLLLGFNTNMLNFIWHGFHYPNSLPCRQSFLYNLIMLEMCFNGIRGLTKLPKNKIVGTFWGAAGLILLIEFIADEKEIPYYACYASIVFIALYALAAYLHKIRKLSEVGVITMITLVLFLEMAINTGVTSVSYVNRKSFVRYDESYDKLIEIAAEDEGTDLFRMERYSLRTKNDGPYFGYASASLFSSTANSKISNLYKKLGLEGNTNAYSFTGATILTQSMLHVGYKLSETELPENPYYTLLATENDTYDKPTYLYKCNFTLPLGYLVPDDTDQFWQIGTGNAAKLQNSFVNITTNVGNVLETLTATINDKTASLTAPADGWYYAAVTNTSIKNVSSKNASGARSWSNVNRGFLIDIGWCKAGDSLSVYTSDDAKMNCTFYRFNEENFVKAYEELMKHPMTLDSVTDSLSATEIRGTVTADKASTLLISLPQDPGWTCTVDGKETNIGTIGDALMAIPVAEGTHEIVLSYETEGLVLGAQISLICLCVLLLILVCKLLIRVIKAGRSEEQEEPVNVGYDRLLRIHRKDEEELEQARKDAEAKTSAQKTEVLSASVTEEHAADAASPQETGDGENVPLREAASEETASEADTPAAEEAASDDEAPAPEVSAEESFSSEDEVPLPEIIPQETAFLSEKAPEIDIPFTGRSAEYYRSFPQKPAEEAVSLPEEEPEPTPYRTYSVRDLDISAYLNSTRRSTPQKPAEEAPEEPVE